jgi:hypothetical protein
MPSNVKLGLAARNAFANAVADRLDIGAVAGRLDIREGSPPTNVSDASSGTLLAQCTMSDPAYQNAASGTAASNPIADGTVVAAGTAGYFRAYPDGAADTAAEFQGTAGETTDAPDLPFDKKSFSLGAKISIRSASLVVPGTAPEPPTPPGDTITEADLTYLGAYDLPTSVGGITLDFNECPIAFRNGEMLHVTADQGASMPGARVFQVAIPTLLTAAPYNVATVTKNFGDIYQDKKVHADSGSTQIWVYGLYADPDNWDDVYWNYGGYYSSDQTSPSWGRSVLNDTAETGTAEAAWSLSGVNNRLSRSGCLRMPADFVAANCPGRPFLVGVGGGYFAIAGGSSMGPCGAAAPRPDTVTYPHESAVANTTIWSYPWITNTLRYGPPIRARRSADYEGGLWGKTGFSPAPGIATADGSSVTLPNSVYDFGSGYEGGLLSITSGAAQQTVTLGARIDVRKYSVTWTNGTPSPDDSYEVRYDPPLNFNDEWPPVAGVGYYTLADRVGGGFAWVRGSPRGVICFLTYATGLQFYGPGGPHYEFWKHAIAVFDQDDLAAAIAGTVQGYEIDPVATWDVEIPGITYPNSIFSLQGPWYRFGGVAYDDANRKVYVAVNHQLAGSNTPRVHCWQIGGSN